MNFNCAFFCVALLSGSPLLSAEEAASPKCSPVTERLRNDISARSSRVLMAVEDALTVNELCAAEIVKIAIVATGADAALVGDIVFTAVTTSPSMSATIVEAAVAAAPKAATKIKDAMQRAIGDDVPETTKTPNHPDGSGDVPSNDLTDKVSPASGKNTVSEGKASITSGKDTNGKAPVTEDSEPSGFGFQTIGLSGIYFASPGGGFRDLIHQNNGKMRCPLNENDGDDDNDSDDNPHPHGNLPGDPVTPGTLKGNPLAAEYGKLQ